MRKRMRAVLGTGLVFGLMIGGGTAANAVEKVSGDKIESELGWYAKSPLSNETYVPEAEEAAPPGSAPFLLDPADVVACEYVRDPNWVIETYSDTASYSGIYAGGDIHLKCGNENSGWRHIQIEHQSQWQQRIDAAGGGAAWDDFMHWSNVAALGYPSAKVWQGNNKLCYTTPMEVWTSGGQLLFTFYPTVIFSTNNHLVITSIPTTTAAC